ncbi:MAG: hypothetical protein MJB12_18120, partial [Firmicutes bacterium]|nr:hypothetical protein [Bacillota bacterium]
RFQSPLLKSFYLEDSENKKMSRGFRNDLLKSLKGNQASDVVENFLNEGFRCDRSKNVSSSFVCVYHVPGFCFSTWYAFIDADERSVVTDVRGREDTLC